MDGDTVYVELVSAKLWKALKITNQRDHGIIKDEEGEQVDLTQGYSNTEAVERRVVDDEETP